MDCSSPKVVLQKIKSDRAEKETLSIQNKDQLCICSKYAKYYHVAQLSKSNIPVLCSLCKDRGEGIWRYAGESHWRFRHSELWTYDEFLGKATDFKIAGKEREEAKKALQNYENSASHRHKKSNTSANSTQESKIYDQISAALVANPKFQINERVYQKSNGYPGTVIGYSLASEEVNIKEKKKRG